MLDIDIDDITRCLIDSGTGKEVRTLVSRIENPKDLKGFNSKEWYVNWAKLLAYNEVYALKTEDGEIQGLAAIENDMEAETVIFSWALRHRGIIRKSLTVSLRNTLVWEHIYLPLLWIVRFHMVMMASYWGIRPTRESCSTTLKNLGQKSFRFPMVTLIR